MKGQTAVEYLMTYGWAILIILIVAGVLAYYGIFAPSGFLAPTARGFGNLGVQSPWIVTPGGDNITLTIQNKVGQTINITDIYAVTTGTTTGGTCSLSPEVQLLSGSTKAIACSSSASPLFPAGAAGASYSLDVSIEFRVESTGLIANDTGTISGKY